MWALRIDRFIKNKLTWSAKIYLFITDEGNHLFVEDGIADSVRIRFIGDIRIHQRIINERPPFFDFTGL